MKQRSCGGPRRRHQKPIQEGIVVAIVPAMTALGLFWGKDAAAFLGPAMNGVTQQQMVTPGSGMVAASVRSASPGFFHKPQTVGAARADARATTVFWAFAMFAGACGIRKVAFGDASKRKHRSCTVVCQAADAPMLVMSQPRIPVTEELETAPATMPATPDVMQQRTLHVARSMIPQTILESQQQHIYVVAPTLMAQMQEPRAAACRATLVGGARCTTAARSAARNARQKKAAAASRAARRAVGSRLQAASCQEDVPSRTFDASRQRLKIQAGLHLAKRVRFGHMRETRSLAGIAEKSNGLFTTIFSMNGDSTYSTQLGMC